MRKNRPNLLFVMSDHQRADSLGMVQCGLEVTPHLNRLRGEALAFTRAYNTCPLCAPARTALATGLPPQTNGVLCNDWEGITAGAHQPLHQYLAEAGYRMGQVGVNHIRVKPSLQERVKFATWYSNPEYLRELKAKGVQLPDSRPYQRDCVERGRDGKEFIEAFSSTKTGISPIPLEDFLDTRFTDEACKFLQAKSEEPFALFVYLWAPHPPLRVPEPYARLFDPSAIALPGNVGRLAQPEPAALRRGVPAQLSEGMTERGWRDVWAAHLGLVRLVDDCVGRMLQALDGGNKGKETLVVFCSDHGDHLGAHCMYQKMEMYEEAIRVPLLIRAPGARPGTCAGLVSHLDLLPTVLDFAGLPVPGQLPGRSLREVVLGKPAPAREAVFSGYDGDNARCSDVRRSVIGTRFKYTFIEGDGEELYDLERDPLELANRAADAEFASEKSRLRKLGRAWAEASGDQVRWPA